MHYVFLTFWLLLIVALLAAALWGGWPEQAVAAMYVVAAVGTVIVRHAISTRYGAVEIDVFVVDAALLAGLIWVTVRANRWWTYGALALQAISTLGHFAKVANPHVWRLGYQLMAEASSLPTILLLLIGIWNERRRRSLGHPPS